MEWVIGAVVGAFTIVIQLYIWVWPRLQSKAVGKKVAMQKMKEELEAAIKKVGAYSPTGLSELKEYCDNRYLPKNLRIELVNIIDYALEYDDWRHESYLVINNEVKRMAQGSEFKELNESLLSLMSGDLYGICSGYEGHFSEPIYHALYEGTLTFELARDSILERRWGQVVKVGDETIKLKEVIEGPQFHKFVEELKQLQKRKSLEMLKKTRETLLEKAQLILKEELNATG